MINSTGLSSDLLFGALNVQKAPELTEPLSFIIGGPLSNKLGNDTISRRSALSASAVGGVTSRCNAGLYGRPNSSSCQQAYNDIPENNRQVSLGNRSADQAWDVPLPFRFISRKSLLTTTEKVEPCLLLPAKLT